jgi:hypothetical protein
MLATALADNRRCAYRVRPISTDDLAFALMRNEERHVPAEVADVTCNGASVRFVKGTGPAVNKGERIFVLIDSPSFTRKATISAQIVFSGDTATDSLIGLAFDSPDELANHGGENFFQLFNRRAAYRDGEPTAGTSLAAAVMPLLSIPNNQLLYPVNVRNLSATGICLNVGHDPDDFLRKQQEILLALRLPGQIEATNIVTKVCYRTSNDTEVFYGCKFDWSATVNAESILEELTEYTLDRLDSGLQETA